VGKVINRKDFLSRVTVIEQEMHLSDEMVEEKGINA